MIGGCHITTMNGLGSGPASTSPQPPPNSNWTHQATNAQTLFSLHQQAGAPQNATMYGASIDLINGVGGPASQLSRSKSLNDISNDSQILAFASDRSINNNNFQGGDAAYNQQQQQQQQPNNLMNCNNLVDPNLSAPYYGNHGSGAGKQQSTNSATTSPLFHHNYLSSTTATHQVNNGFGCGGGDARQAPLFQQETFYRTSPIDNQCSSNKQQQQPTVNQASNNASPASPGGMFSVCNPMVMNLNGVTDQIGNLHL